MKLWIGTSGFQYPEWKGAFYPESLPLSKMLAFYAERFFTTEVNYSFRRIPSAKTISAWAAGTPANFRFSLKAPQKITHFAKLRDCGETVRYFHEVVGGLDEKLGAILFQLPPRFVKDAPLLLDFLEALPHGMRAAFEFRHASWLTDDVFALLKENNAALCIAENEDFATPRVATADFGYLRLRREDYAGADIANWAGWIREQENGWGEAFVYFKHEERGVGPKFAQRLIAAV
ncbi:MAG: hypothetical protein QOD99_1810 [Chthoniobacter sp.]|jgi:uncharacterized protein YecE (DUF72 family)|nr:hypothetical protein [Chthoniobacter sp.]